MLILKTDRHLGNCPCRYTEDESKKDMQIPNEVRKSVVFVCIKDKIDPEQLKAIGTAFLVSVIEKEIDRSFGYIVTAKHVIDGAKANSINGIVYLRVNSKDKNSFFVETKISDWKFHPTETSSVDVAVINLYLKQDICDVVTIDSKMAATNAVVSKEYIGIGDEVFITGLFVNHIGRQRNLPIVRIGNIALMPEEPIHTKDLGNIEALLIEARSIGGLSGSPVFVYMGAMRNRGGNINIGGVQQMFYWLGLMHGHWDIPEDMIDIEIKDINKPKNVNMGIAIVIPVTKILEVINQPIFLEIRKKRVSEFEENKTPIIDVLSKDTDK